MCASNTFEYFVDGVFGGLLPATNANLASVLPVTASTLSIVICENTTVAISSPLVVNATGCRVSIACADASQTCAHDGGKASQLLSAAAGSVSLAGLVLQNGFSATGGGAIAVAAGASVSVAGCVFQQDSTSFAGGAVMDAGTFTAVASKFLQNTAQLGGALYTVGGGIAVVNSTFLNNTATTGGAVYDVGGNVSITGSNLAGNTAGGKGKKASDPFYNTTYIATTSDNIALR